MTTHNGKKITQRGGMGGEYGKMYANMQAREESLGEAGEYEAEAAYAAQYQDSLKPKYKMNPEEQQTAWEDEQYRSEG